MITSEKGFPLRELSLYNLEVSLLFYIAFSDIFMAYFYNTIIF